MIIKKFINYIKNVLFPEEEDIKKLGSQLVKEDYRNYAMSKTGKSLYELKLYSIYRYVCNDDCANEINAYLDTKLCEDKFNIISGSYLSIIYIESNETNYIFIDAGVGLDYDVIGNFHIANELPGFAMFKELIEDVWK